MTEIEVILARGGSQPLLVGPTSTDVLLFSGGGTLCGWSLRDTASTQANQTSGNATAPLAGATIASLTGLAAGTYTVTWTVGLQGAAAAADANNFELFDTAGNVIASVNPGAAGEYPQLQVNLTVAAGATIGVKAIGAGTAAIVYSADLAIAAQDAIPAVVEIQDIANVLGEISFATFRSNTEWFGSDGPQIMGKLLVHVISGTVTGTVFAYPTYT